PGRVGEHLQHVVFRSRIVVFGGENRLFVPDGLPARLGITGVVTFGCHGIAWDSGGFAADFRDGGLVPTFRSPRNIAATPFRGLRKSYGHQQIYDFCAAFDMKSLKPDLAASESGTSDRRH